MPRARTSSRQNNSGSSRNALRREGMGIRAGRPRKSKTMSFAHADGGCLHEFSVNQERRTRYSAVVYGWRLMQATAVVKMRLHNISGDSDYRLRFTTHPGMLTTYRGFCDEYFTGVDWRRSKLAPKYRLVDLT